MTDRQERDGSTSRPWVGIAANAHLGVGSGRRRVERLTTELERRGFAVRLSWTPAERSMLVAAARAESQCSCLVAAGGDGTVAALVNDRPEVPITVLRAGTENLFAGHFGLSARPERVAATIAEGRVIRMDLGQTGERRFTLMAGVGFDADVVSRHHVARVGRAGVARRTHRGAYVEPVLRSSFRYPFPPLSVRITDPGHEEELVGTTAFVFNLPRYALGLPFAPSALGDDGWLDLVVFRNAGPWNALRYLWMVVRGVHTKRVGVYHRRVARVTIACAETVPVQLDGDPGGSVNGGLSSPPWCVEVVPQAIDVLVPRSHVAHEVNGI
ncbi:MAG TPA: diacylglycerol kinase family protein [Isosphaeraceae bacterium]|jgi:diacylglycerol kinase family enzyme|nr:diacylglycerol kinase family protein [Isosphaeraceae bacterium]